MTITFNCPNCSSLCAFKDVYAGRRARCLQCNQIFIIPTDSNTPIQKIEQPVESDEPLQGFYEAVFKYSLPAIFNRQSLSTLIFILGLTTLKFFVIHLDFSFGITGRSGAGFNFFLPVGAAIACLAWGGIFWCYAEIICATALDIEPLPQVTFGGGFGYLFAVFKSFYSFFMAVVVVFLPAIIAKNFFNFLGVKSQLAEVPFILLGLFLFPMAVLTVSIGRDLTMLFRPDYFFVPIKKAFWNYMFVVILFTITFWLQYVSRNFSDVANSQSHIILLNLGFVLAVQIVAITIMRVIGLFYRHFACYFKW